MSDFMSEMVFDSPKPLEVPVKIAGESFVLKGASAGAAQDYNAMRIRSVKLGDGAIDANGKPDLTKIGLDNLSAFMNVETMMVSRCLFRRSDKGDLPVPETEVKGWKDEVVSKLYERIQLLSPALFPDAKTRDELKNG